MRRSRPTSRLDPVELQAGRAVLRFEPAGLFARRWTCGGAEFLRGVYPAVRLENWSTAEPGVQWLRRDITPRGFSLALQATYGGGKPFLTAEVELLGTGAGEIAFRFRGRALRAFQTNRTGFCILHPAAAAGTPCVITHPDGSRTRGTFPEAISPHQPFLNIQGISYVAANGCRCEVEMTGEVFEMEDQRNWTDASFKTYCRPLALPFPYRIEPGQTVTQEVRVRVIAPARQRARAFTRVPLLSAGPRKPAVEIGTSLAAGAATSSVELQMLVTAGFRHLRVEVDAASSASIERLRRILRALSAGESKLELHTALLVPSRGGRLNDVAVALSHTRLAGQIHCAVFDAALGLTTVESFRRVARCFREHRVQVELGAGTRRDFVEFNRKRPVVPGRTFATYAIDPQVHAFDETSMIETTEVHALTVAQTRALAGVPVMPAPITLGVPRRPGQVIAADPRQHSPFAAVWTLAALAGLTRGGAAAATFFCSQGPAGLVERIGGSPSPVMRVLAAYAQFDATRAAPLVSSHPLDVCGLLLERGDATRILVANLRSTPGAVRLDDFPAGPWTVAQVSAENSSRGSARLRRAGTDATLTLPVYGIVQLDRTAS